MLTRYSGFFRTIAVVITFLILLSGILSAVFQRNIGAALLTLLVAALSAYVAYTVYSAASAAFLALDDLTDRTRRIENTLQEIRQALCGHSVPQQSPSVPGVVPVSSAAEARLVAPSGEGGPVAAVDRSERMVRCPVCQMEQRSDRNVCFRCGTRFVDASQTEI